MNTVLKLASLLACLAALSAFGCNGESTPLDAQDAQDARDDSGQNEDPGSPDGDSFGDPADDGGSGDQGGDDASPTQDSASVVSATLPSTLACGTTFSASITFRNTGAATWTDDVYRMGMVGDSDPFLPAGDQPRVVMPAGSSVPPGGTVAFDFIMQAPRAAGTYTTDYQMVHEAVGWFGEIVTRDVEVTGSCTAAEEDDAEVAEVNFPVTLICGDAVHASLTVRNVGTATWTAAAGYNLGVSDGLTPPGAGPNPFSPNDTSRYIMGELAAIAPDDTYTFWFTLYQPNPGDYTIHYQMVHEGVRWFPAAPLASITVSVVEPCEPTNWELTSPPSQYLDMVGGVNWAIDAMLADYPPDASILFATGTGPAGNGCYATQYIYDTMMYSYGVAEKITHGPGGLIATVDPFAGDEMTVKASEAFSESFDIIANPADGGNCVRRYYVGTSVPAWP